MLFEILLLLITVQWAGTEKISTESWHKIAALLSWMRQMYSLTWIFNHPDIIPKVGKIVITDNCATCPVS